MRARAVQLRYSYWISAWVLTADTRVPLQVLIYAEENEAVVVWSVLWSTSQLVRAIEATKVYMINVAMAYVTRCLVPHGNQGPGCALGCHGQARQGALPCPCWHGHSCAQQGAARRQSAGGLGQMLLRTTIVNCPQLLKLTTAK